eukprot:Seg4497.1 transcript_id=Seg4497.1/GoldUCD/mRNA.D3Y31 product="AT-rich interactive domain-containing protein 3A" protein_id=Seg4497.1/GoldUCD/D3Y31
MKIVPVIRRQPLDLFKFYQIVKYQGGFCQVVKKRRWSRIIRELDFPVPITAFSLRTNYLRHLYEFECMKMGKPVPDFIKWANHENTQENGEEHEDDNQANKNTADQPTKVVTTLHNITTGQKNVPMMQNGVTNIVPNIISISQVKPIMRSYVQPILPKVTTSTLVATNQSLVTGNPIVRNANLVTVAPWRIANTFVAGAHNFVAGQTIPMSQVSVLAPPMSQNRNVVTVTPGGNAPWGIANTFVAGAHNFVAGQTMPMSQVGVFAPPVSQNRNVVAVTPDGKVISAPLYAPMANQTVTRDNVTSISRTLSERQAQQVVSSNGIDQPMSVKFEIEDDVIEVFSESGEPDRPEPSLNAGRNDSFIGDKVAASTQTVVQKRRDNAAREHLSWVANKGCLKCSCCGRDITGERGKPVARQPDNDLMPVANKRRKPSEENHNPKGTSDFEEIIIVDDAEEEQDTGPNSDEIIWRTEQTNAVSSEHWEPNTQSRPFPNESPSILTINAAQESDNSNSPTNVDAVREPCPPLIRIEDLRNETRHSTSEGSPIHPNSYSGSTTQSAFTWEEITRSGPCADALARMSARHANPSAAFMTSPSATFMTKSAASPSSVTSCYFDSREAFSPFSAPSTMPPLVSSSSERLEQASGNLSTGNDPTKSPCQCRTLGCCVTSQQKSSTEIFSPPPTSPRTAPPNRSPATTSSPPPRWIPPPSHKTAIAMPRLIRSDAMEAAASRTKIMPVLQQQPSTAASCSISDDARIETVCSANTLQAPYVANHVNEHGPNADESQTIFSRPNITHENNATDVSLKVLPITETNKRTFISSGNSGSISGERHRVGSSKEQNNDDSPVKKTPAFGFEINEQTEKSLSLVIHLNGLRYEGVLFS